MNNCQCLLTSDSVFMQREDVFGVFFPLTGAEGLYKLRTKNTGEIGTF